MKKYIGLSIIVAVLLVLYLFLSNHGDEPQTVLMDNSTSKMTMDGLIDEIRVHADRRRELEIAVLEERHEIELRVLRDQLARRDTVFMHDTVTVHDTVSVHDTIYVRQQNAPVLVPVPRPYYVSAPMSELPAPKTFGIGITGNRHQFHAGVLIQGSNNTVLTLGYRTNHIPSRDSWFDGVHVGAYYLLY